MFLDTAIKLTPGFGILDNVGLGLLIVLIDWLLALKSAAIFKKSLNPRMALISNSLFWAGIYEIFHFLSAFLYFYNQLDVLGLVEFVFSFFSNIVIAGSIIVSFVLPYSLSEKDANVFNSKVSRFFLIAFFSFMFMLGIGVLLFNYEFYRFIELTIVYNPLSHLLDNTFFLLSAFIIVDAKIKSKHQKFSFFDFGLIFLGITQLYSVSIEYVESFYRLLVHLNKILGITMLYIGINDYNIFRNPYRFREKLLIYPAIFLIISYYIFISLLSLMSGFTFPAYIQYVLLFYFLSLLGIEYIFSERFSKPVLELINYVEKFSPNARMTKLQTSSNDEIGILTEKVNEMSEIMWNHTEELVDKQDKLENVYSRNRLVNQIINNMLNSASLEEAVRSINIEIAYLLQADAVWLRLYDTETNTFSNIVGEYIRDNIFTDIKNFQTTPETDNAIYKLVSISDSMYLISDTTDPNLPEQILEICKQYQIKSAIYIPVRLQGRIIGIIVAATKNAVFDLTEDRKMTIKSLTSQSSLAINLFRTNERLKKSLLNEQVIRIFISEIRNLQDHDQIYDHLLERLIELFQVEVAFHMHMDDNGNMQVQLCETVGDKVVCRVDDVLITRAEYDELTVNQSKLIVHVNNLENEEFSEVLKTKLLNHNINSFMLYPASNQVFKEVEENIVGKILIGSVNQKKWTSEDVDFFKLLVDTVSIIYLELKQRQEIDEVRRTFIATLTHDLRSPLFAEQKGIEFLLSRNKNMALSDITEYLEDIYKTNEELLRIVNNLLSVYHYESGKFELDFKEMSVGDVIHDVVRSMNYLARDKNSEIIVDIPDNLPLITADRNEISRVYSNLISNAIKHTRPGTRVVLSAKADNVFVTVAINDNGEGIQEADRDKIFQRYPTKKRKVGTGLGLYLTKQIVESHKGKVWFDTTEGQGTTFYVRLPIKQTQ